MTHSEPVEAVVLS